MNSKKDNKQADLNWKPSSKASSQPELLNWYEVMPKKFLTKQHNPNFEKHGLKIPFRMLIIGNSGAGKTQTLLNIIHNMNGTFNNIFIITKNKDEPLYNYLEDKLDKDSLKIVEGVAKAPNLEKDIDKKDQTLIVMDDLVLEKNQSALEEYFIRARKLNCSLIYISQSYYRVPRMIRQNLNYLVIKQVSSFKDLYRIMAEYTLGVEKQELKKLYESSTKEKQDFLLVDLDANPQDRFRKNFSEIYDLN
jgi:ABC-type dipeptide/oligopeptide/nickel transport system ATPase component